MSKWNETQGPWEDTITECIEGYARKRTKKSKTLRNKVLTMCPPPAPSISITKTVYIHQEEQEKTRKKSYVSLPFTAGWEINKFFLSQRFPSSAPLEPERFVAVRYGKIIPLISLDIVACCKMFFSHPRSQPSGVVVTGYYSLSKTLKTSPQKRGLFVRV